MLTRAASGMMAIVDVCPRHFVVNGPFAQELAVGFVRRLIAQVGKASAATSLKREAARRKKEVVVTGEKQWCAAQRAILAPGAGTKVFLN